MTEVAAQEVVQDNEQESFARTTGGLTSIFLDRVNTAYQKDQTGNDPEASKNFKALKEMLDPKFLELAIKNEGAVKALMGKYDSAQELTLFNTFSDAGYNLILDGYKREVIQELHDMIDALPQRKHLTDENIHRWLSAIMDFEPQRVKWHIKRLNGLGGSEIGTVVAPFMDVHDPFDQPKDIYMSKLMLTIPEPPNGHMRRGTVMESVICDEFRREYNAVECTEDLKKFLDFKDPDHPWLVGNPDDLVMINGRKYMVDYKCPMPGFKKKYDTYGVSFGYVAQLHHYTLIARKLGIKVDGLLLCSWDMENWNCDVRPVTLNEELMEKIEIAGDWLFTDHILKNKMPRGEFAPRVTFEEDDPVGQRVLTLMEQAAKIGTLAKRAYYQDKQLREEIAELLEDYKFGESKVSHALIDGSVTRVLDEELAVSHLVSLGYDPEDFKSPGDYKADMLLAEAQNAGLDLSGCREMTLNHDLVYRALEANGIEREQVERETFGLRLSNSGNPEIKNNVKGLREEADTVISTFVKEMTGKFIPSFAAKQTARRKP